jgi:hypothetical protein
MTVEALELVRAMAERAGGATAKDNLSVLAAVDALQAEVRFLKGLVGKGAAHLQGNIDALLARAEAAEAQVAVLREAVGKAEGAFLYITTVVQWRHHKTAEWLVAADSLIDYAEDRAHEAKAALTDTAATAAAHDARIRAEGRREGREVAERSFREGFRTGEEAGREVAALEAQGMRSTKPVTEEAAWHDSDARALTTPADGGDHE